MVYVCKASTDDDIAAKIHRNGTVEVRRLSRFNENVKTSVPVATTATSKLSDVTRLRPLMIHKSLSF